MKGYCIVKNSFVAEVTFNIKRQGVVKPPVFSFKK